MNKIASASNTPQDKLDTHDADSLIKKVVP